MADIQDATYLGSNNEKVTMFHRRGRMAWDHPFKEPYMMEAGVKKNCPICERRKK